MAWVNEGVNSLILGIDTLCRYRRKLHHIRILILMDFEQGSAHSAPSHSVKRRASKACNLCRTKKVKCSVVHSGVPCHNCCLTQATCTVSAYRRVRRPRKHQNESQAGMSVDDDADGRRSGAEEKSSPLEKFLADPPQSLDFHLGDYVPGAINTSHALSLALTFCRTNEQERLSAHTGRKNLTYIAGSCSSG